MAEIEWLPTPDMSLHDQVTAKPNDTFVAICVARPVRHHRRRTWVAAAEAAKARGKGGLHLVAVSLLAPCGAQPVVGIVSIATAGKAMTVTTNATRSIEPGYAGVGALAVAHHHALDRLRQRFRIDAAFGLPAAAARLKAILIDWRHALLSPPYRNR